MTTEITPAAHSQFSPSGSSRWLKCPGSIQLEQTLKIENKSSPAALEGSAAHELAADCLIRDVHPETMLGHEYIEGYPVDADMVLYIQQYIDYVNLLNHPQGSYKVEERVDLTFLHDGTFGTADYIAIHPTVVHVVDLKYGKGIVVDVDNNSQMKIYAIGALQEIHRELGSLRNIKIVVLHIAQPRALHKEGPFRTWETTVSELQTFAKHIKERIADACSDDPSFQPGEQQCRWCPAAPVCKHLAEFNLNLAKLEFADFKTPGPVPIKSPNTISAEEIEIILNHSKQLRSWLNSVAEYAQRELERGREVPGYKLVYGRSTRAWKSAADAQKQLEVLGFLPSELVKKKFISPAQCDALLGKRKEEMDHYWTKPQGKVTLAKLSDARSPIDPTSEAKDDFAEFK